MKLDPRIKPSTWKQRKAAYSSPLPADGVKWDLLIGSDRWECQTCGGTFRNVVCRVAHGEMPECMACVMERLAPLIVNYLEEARQNEREARLEVAAAKWPDVNEAEWLTIQEANLGLNEAPHTALIQRMVMAFAERFFPDKMLLEETHHVCEAIRAKLWAFVPGVVVVGQEIAPGVRVTAIKDGEATIAGTVFGPGAPGKFRAFPFTGGQLDATLPDPPWEPGPDCRPECRAMPELGPRVISHHDECPRAINPPDELTVGQRVPGGVVESIEHDGKGPPLVTIVADSAAGEPHPPFSTKAIPPCPECQGVNRHWEGCPHTVQVLGADRAMMDGARPGALLASDARLNLEVVDHSMANGPDPGTFELTTMLRVVVG